MKIISLRTALFFSVAVFSFVLGNAQNLTISTSGQTTSPGTNWSISGNVLNVAASGSAEIHPSVITNHLLNSGNLTINLPWQSGAARSVNINASIAYTGSAARTLTINCANDIVFANAVGITSATASLNVVLRSAIGLSLGAPDHGLVKMDGINIDTKGGNLWVGGGTTSTSWNGLTVGNSYAVTWLDDVSGISLIGSTLNTAGGHIALYAQSFNSGDDDGTNYGINVENSNISSGSGSIYMAGGLYGKYTAGIGMRIVGTTGTSISSSTGAIDIYGYGTDAASVGNAWRHAAFVNGSVSIKSTSGSITMFGQAAFNSAVIDKEGLVLADGAVVASQTGSILLKGTNTLESSGQYSNSIRFAAANVINSIRIGFDGNIAYSGNITIEGNSIYQRSTHSGSGSIAVQTTGTLTIQPTGNSFTYMRAGDDGAGATLTYDDDWNFGTTLGGFVYGKTTNTTALTYSNALTTNGPITMYTGAHVQNAAVSSSAAITFHSADFTLGNGINIATNTASAITINANGNFTSEGTIRRTISSANGTITIHADKDANGSGDLSIDYITFNSGTGNVIIRFETVNWLFGSGQEPYFNGTGNITIEPSDPSFPYAIYTQWFNFDQDNNGFSGLTLGKSGNAFDIIHSGSALSVAGPVTMFGANVAISSTLSTSSATGHIRLNATADITPMAAMTTQGGSVVLWADTDGASGGRMSLTSSITTNGGSIYAGGGSASETLNGIVVPTGYATSSNNSLSGITVAGSTINSGGGSIRLKGSNNSVDGNNAGLIVYGNTTISSGSGSLSLFGQRTGNPSTSAGLFIGTDMNSGSLATGNVSISATSGHIYLEGITTSITSSYSWCHGLAIVEYFGDDVSITSTTGNISMFGDATSAAAFSGEAVGLVIQSGSTTSLTNIATDGGTILINGKSSNAGFDYGSSYRGANTAGNISIGDNNTGNITLQFGSLSGNSNVGSVALQSAGAYVLEGNSAAAFGTAIELTNAYTFGSSATSFRLGSTNNNQNVTVSTPVSVAGPISVYGGNVFTQQNLTSTASGAAILLQATGYIDVSSGDIIQTSGGNITLRSNSSGVAVVTPNVTTGSITLNSGSSLLSNGGNITLGGNFTGTQGAGLYAASNRVGGAPAVLINNATLTAAGGNINIYGKCTSSYDDGVRLQATITTTGAGNIGIYGDAWGGYNGTEFFGGISFFNEISRIETEDGDVTLEGILTNSSHAQGYALSFYRSEGLTGQTKHIQILSKNGDIQITANPGTSIGKGIGHSSWGNIYFGSPSNNNYIATGSIKFIYSSLVNAANNGFKVKTSGPVTYEPIANSFVADQDFPPTTHYVLADGASSLTIGKAATISNINLKHPISIPGSINVYGGNLYLYDDIASTGSGNISILGASSVYTSGLASITRDLTTTGGTIRVEADSDENGTGVLNIDYMSFGSGTGPIIIRGETMDWVSSSETVKPNINGSGTFTFESNDGNFGQAVQLVWFKIANTITGVTVGKQSSNTFTYLNSTNGLTINGPVTINGSSIEISTPLSLTNNLSLRTSGAVTQTIAGTINSVGLALNGTGTVTLTNTANNFGTLAGGAVGSLIGATQIIDASGGLTIGTVGSNTGLLGSSTIRVETLAGNLTLAGNISTTNATTDAVILTAAKSTAIGTPAGGDILVTGSPTITMATGGIAKLYSGYDMTSTGLSTFVGASNVRYNYDETSTTFNPALSANNKYAFYRAGQGYGDLNIVSTVGDLEGSTWSYANGVITTISGTANVSNTAIQEKLNAGNLSIEANKITFSANITGTTSNSLNILSKTHIVNTNATTITSLGGDVLFASNVDDATDNENTVNGYIVLTSGLTMNTNGGDIAFGGGNNSGTDYALGTSVYPYEGIRIDGIVNLNSGGGNISMRGKSYAIATTAGAWGVGFWNLSTGLISSGIGAITLDGFSQASGGSHSSGLYTHGALTITSENTTADAIRLIGKCTANGGEAWGIEAESALSLLATGTGGGITLSSSQQNSANNYEIVLRGETNILAKSGPISMLGGQSGGLTTGTLLLGNNLFLGSKASSAVLTSTSNLTIQYHLYNFSGYTPKLATSGTLNWKPVTTSFGQNVATDFFSWSQNGQTLSGLTIGNSGNTYNVSLNSVINVAGPVNVYGATIGISGALTAIGNDVSLYASAAVTQSQPIVSSGLSLNGTGTFTLTNTSNNFTTIAGGAAGSLLGATQIVDVSGGLTIGTVGANSGLNGANTIKVETLAGNLTLAESISTSSTSTDAVILNAAQSTVIGIGTGGDIIVSGTPIITMGSGGIAKLFSGLESTSIGLTTLVGGSSNVRNNYDETTSTFSPVLSANNKYAIYRTSAGVGALTIVSSNGDAINTTWTYDNGVINTITSPVNILSSVIENYLATGPLTINAGNTTVSSAITSTSSNALVFNANSTLSNLTPTTNLNAAITNAGSITINTGFCNVAHNITTTSAAAITISATNDISTSTLTSRTISTQGGNITLNADNDDTGSGWLDIDYLTLDPGAGNIIVRGETFNVNPTQSLRTYINGTGSFTFESNDASFAEHMYTSWFVIDQDNNGISGLNFGKSGNAVNVYVNTALTVAGPISIYGNYVEFTGNMTSSADGDIFIKSLGVGNPSVAIGSGITINKSAGTGTLTFQANGRVTNNGTLSATGAGLLNVVMWSDYDNTNNDGGVSQFGTISTNGGHVWMGGSASANGSYSWNNLTVGDGPSIGTYGYNCNAMDLFGPITTAGGDVLIWASTPGCGSSSIASDGSRLINAGSGDITFIAPNTTGAIELTSTGVISLLPHAGSYASALTLGGTTTSGNFTFNTSYYNGLKINSLANTGLVIGQYAGHLSGGTAVVQGNTSNVTASTALSTKSLEIYGGSVITNAALTAAGNIILDADNGNFLSQNTKGVEVNAALTTTNNGNITLHGRGGSTTGVQTHGINVTNLIDAGGTGNIELIGYGGLSFDNATGSSCHGVNIEGANAWVKSNGGNVVINGYGGGAGAGTYSQGVPLLTNAKVSAAGSGTVTITGTGGVNTAIGLRGVVLTSGSSVYSSGGAITITGVAGTYGSDNSDGISMETATIGNTSTGSILLSGQPGGGTGSEAISMNGTNTIGAASHNNTIVLRGNNLSIAGTNSVLTTGQVTIEPHSTSFSNALSFPIANLSIASTITGLTLGKSSNSSAITLTTAANINGPINIYGGAVALNGNLTTLNNTTGDILIKANTLSGTPAISVANNRSLTFNLAQSTTYNGSVTGTNISFIKTGVGTLGFGSTLPSSANVITQAGTLQFTSNQSVADVEMNGGTLIIDDTKKLTINGDFTALAAGTLQNNGTIELVGPESFPGLNTNISAMKNLEVNRSAGVLLNNALTLTGALTLTSGVLDLNNNTLTHAGTTLTKTNGKIDASTGVLAFANDQTALTLPTGLFVPDALTGVAEVAEIFKSAGAATVTINDDLMVTGALRTAASTGALVLGIGTELNLNGNFINNGAITFDTLATVLQGTSSQASGTGVYNVRQKVTGSSANGQANGRFWYLGSAVANAQASAVMTANANKIYHWEANQASPSWIELTDANAVLQTGKGYSIRMGDQSVLNFSGSAMHNNTLQIPSYRQTTGSFQGYNLITNPYLSYLDWETVWQGSNAVNFQPTIWYRLANNTNVMVFDTYNAQSNIGTSNNSANGSTSVTRYIPPMQAVWMRLNTGVSSANLMVDNSARSHYTAVQGGLTAGLKTTAQDFPAFVRLNLIQGAFQDQTIVYLKDAAAASYDNFDSDKMFLTGYPQVYSQVAGKKLVINGLKDNKKVTVVPLFIDIPAAGNYTFKASELNIENGLILLEDKLEGVLQDLTINDTYQFAAASGTTSNRFYLRIILPNNQPIAQGPTSNWVNEEVTFTEGGTILVSSDGAGRVMVTQQVTEDASGIVLVRDAAGRLVFEGETQGAQTIFTLEQPSGLYFVEVQIGNTSKIEKIVLR